MWDEVFVVVAYPERNSKRSQLPGPSAFALRDVKCCWTNRRRCAVLGRKQEGAGESQDKNRESRFLLSQDGPANRTRMCELILPIRQARLARATALGPGCCFSNCLSALSSDCCHTAWEGASTHARTLHLHPPRIATSSLILRIHTICGLPLRQAVASSSPAATAPPVVVRGFVPLRAASIRLTRISLPQPCSSCRPHRVCRLAVAPTLLHLLGPGRKASSDCLAARHTRFVDRILFRRVDCRVSSRLGAASAVRACFVPVVAYQPPGDLLSGSAATAGHLLCHICAPPLWHQSATSASLQLARDIVFNISGACSGSTTARPRRWVDVHWRSISDHR